MATEKTHPALFVKETRTLRDRKGLDRVVTMPKIYWGSYDFIVNQTDMDAADILTIADESAEHYQMSWHDYLPEGLAHIDHYFRSNPELLNQNKDKGQVAGYIGPVSKLQIKALEKQKIKISKDTNQ